MILSFLSLVSLAFAQIQFDSPIVSVEVSVKGSGGLTEGGVTELWQLSAGFTIEDTTAIQPGDWFDIVIRSDVLEGYGPSDLTPYSYGFDIVDSEDTAVFHVSDTDKQWTLRATASDYMSNSAGSLRGDIIVEFYISLASPPGPFAVSVHGVSGPASIVDISDGLTLVPTRLANQVVFLSTIPLDPQNSYTLDHSLGEGLTWASKNDLEVVIINNGVRAVEVPVSARADSLVTVSVGPYGDLEHPMANSMYPSEITGDNVSEYCASLSVNGELVASKCLPAGLGLLGVAGGTGTVQTDGGPVFSSSIEPATSESPIILNSPNATVSQAVPPMPISQATSSEYIHQANSASSFKAETLLLLPLFVIMV